MTLCMEKHPHIKCMANGDEGGEKAGKKVKLLQILIRLKDTRHIHESIECVWKWVS